MYLSSPDDLDGHYDSGCDELNSPRDCFLWSICPGKWLRCTHLMSTDRVSQLCKRKIQGEFERLEVWELVPPPDKAFVMSLSRSIRLSQKSQRIFIKPNLNIALESLRNMAMNLVTQSGIGILHWGRSSKLDEDKRGIVVDPSHYRGLMAPSFILLDQSDTRPYKFTLCMGALHLQLGYMLVVKIHGVVTSGSIQLLGDRIVKLMKLMNSDHGKSSMASSDCFWMMHLVAPDDRLQEKLYLLHMDLYGPMHVTSVNGKKYILVIVDDYSRFTWVKCLRSKDEAPDFIIKFLKMIQVRLKVPVRRIRTDNGTKFVNKTLREYYEKVGISHETFVSRSSQQNGVIERRNRTLIEAARTMLIYVKAPLFLWAEAVATAYYTQNRSIVRLRHGKTPYELLHDKLPDLSFFYVFGALCYPTNDSENLGKLQPKDDIGIFIGYAPTKKAF
ncbi:retrovirus-related pol polyprotein from transposon TNT 1-94 [Tanacetum coccineum]